MEKEKGYKYVFEGKTNLEEFAKSVLVLTNLKSNDKGVIDFKTYQDSNVIEVITTVENDTYLESHIGEIKSKKEIDIFVINENVLSVNNEKFIEEIDKKMEESDYQYECHFYFQSFYQ